MNELRYTNLFIGTMLIISCALLVCALGYANTTNNNYENMAIAAQQLYI